MIALFIALFAVLAGDQAVKLVLSRVLGSGTVSLGPFGRVQVVAGRLWLRRLGGHPSQWTLWIVWTVTAATLLAASRWVPTSSAFVGLLLGGSLSNAIESSARGAVCDYVCLRFWPAFNLADLAVAIGAVGILIELVLVAMRGTAS
jgi:signal peptidase II